MRLIAGIHNLDVLGRLGLNQIRSQRTPSLCGGVHFVPGGQCGDGGSGSGHGGTFAALTKQPHNKRNKRKAQ